MKVERIFIFGVGAAGGNILLNLAASHLDLEYVAVDSDIVEERNILAGTQPYGKSDLKRPKTQAIQRILASRGKKIGFLTRRIESRKDLDFVRGKYSLIVDCFDNAPSRNLFIEATWPVVHVGFSAQLTGEVAWNEVYSKMRESKADARVDVCQLRLARPFIHALAGVAALAISEFLETGTKRNVYFDSKLNLRIF